MFCEQCGNKLPENAMFCPKCGTPAPQDDENIEVKNEGTEEHVENVEEPIIKDKKPKKHRKKSKAIIALCTAVVVVGASVGGFALYQNYEKKARVQKYYDLMASSALSGFGSSDGTEYNYEKLSKKEKKEYNETLSKVGINVKNHYITYPFEWDICDVHVGNTFESGVCSDVVLNLPEDAYNCLFVDTYTISEGKIYGELDAGSEDEPEIYKVEGKVIDPTNYMTDCAEKYIIKKYEDDKETLLKSYEVSEKTYNKALELLEKDLKKSIENVAVGENGAKLLFKIKGIEGNKLQIDDCYVYPSGGEDLEYYIEKVQNNE